jgi:hypothetical protein
MKPLHDIAPETLRWMVTLLRLENRALRLGKSSGSDMAKVGAISIAAETQCSHVLPDSDSGKEQ